MGAFQRFWKKITNYWLPYSLDNGIVKPAPALSYSCPIKTCHSIELLCQDKNIKHKCSQLFWITLKMLRKLNILLWASSICKWNFCECKYILLPKSGFLFSSFTCSRLPIIYKTLLLLANLLSIFYILSPTTQWVPEDQVCRSIFENWLQCSVNSTAELETEGVTLYFVVLCFCDKFFKECH